MSLAIAPDRDGSVPGAPCHDSGRGAAPDGLTTALPLDALSEAQRPRFGTAAGWPLLHVEVEGTRATAVIHSSLSPPIRSGT